MVKLLFCALIVAQNKHSDYCRGQELYYWQMALDSIGIC